MVMNDLPDDAPIELNGEIFTMGQLREMHRAQLDSISSGLVQMRDEWVAHRASSGVEARWRKARKLYMGEEVEPDLSMASTLRHGPMTRGGQNAQPRSRIVVNIVRPKVDQAVARMCEILLPTDDQNWDIRPTPVPEGVAKRVGDKRPTVDPESGKPTGVTADDEAQAVIEDARDRSSKMKDRIADHLVESDFNGHCRQGIEDGGSETVCDVMVMTKFAEIARSRTEASGSSSLSRFGFHRCSGSSRIHA
jgi:hypothetical protein